MNESVLDFNAKLNAKKEQDVHANEKVKTMVLSQIEDATNTAIEQFVNMGVDNLTATDIVVTHLSNLVMMHDINKRLK